jgi:hypothetical protein
LIVSTVFVFTTLLLSYPTMLLRNVRDNMADKKIGSPLPSKGPARLDIAEDFQFDLSLFSIPDHYSADLNAVMIPHGLIMDRIEKLAVDILHAYKFRELGTRVHMLCVLKGGHQFFSDLCNCLKQLTLTACPDPPYPPRRSNTNTDACDVHHIDIRTAHGSSWALGSLLSHRVPLSLSRHRRHDLRPQ